MAYSDHFQHADDVINHLNTIVPAITDPLLKAKYMGFVSVAAVTVYEMGVKDIFIDFARKKHKVLGNFTESYFNRINGKIRLKVIKDDYIPRFGSKYKIRFQKRLDETATTYFHTNRRDIKNSYSNLIIWRNDFAHEGKINTTATYEEAVQAYQDGKEIIHCLARCMNR